jgi:hypothetical protein
MQHIAIMQKSWGLTEKIATGQKIIESRWYNVKYLPWGKIFPGEKIYFKNTGEPVAIQAEVDKVLYFSDLTPEKVQAILAKYGKSMGIEAPDIPRFFEMFKQKKYCMLIYLKNAQRIPPFKINKQGFGVRASWISVERVSQVSVLPTSGG